MYNTLVSRDAHLFASRANGDVRQYAHFYWRRLVEGWSAADVMADFDGLPTTDARENVPRPPDVDYETFLNEQAEIATTLQQVRGGWSGGDLAHNAHRRLCEGWSHANLIRDIKGEPIESPTPWEPTPGHPLPDTPGDTPHDPTITRLTLPVRQDGTRGWRDAVSGRPLLFASWFPMLWFARNDRARFTRTLDMLQSWGVDGVRYFCAVGHPSYWPGREVLPIGSQVGPAWPDFNEHHSWALGQFRARGMAAHITAGDGQIFDDEMAVMHKAAEVVREYTDVVCMVDWNEAWQNSRNRDDDASYYAKLVRPIAALGIPWATSAHSGGDDGEHLLNMSVRVGAPVATIHGPGGTTLMVRHIFNHRYEGVKDAVGLWQGEPRGPGRDVSAGRVDAAGWIVLSAAAAAMTGQGYVLHCSRGVRDLDNDEPWETFAPYFQRARKLLDRFPLFSPRAWGHGGNGGTNPEAVLASTRGDGKFHEDDGVPRMGSGQFHRCDVARFDDGTRVVLAYGGQTNEQRAARFVKAFRGAVYDTHGAHVAWIEAHPGDVFIAPGGEDGYVLIGR